MTMAAEAPDQTPGSRKEEMEKRMAESEATHQANVERYAPQSTMAVVLYEPMSHTRGLARVAPAAVRFGRRRQLARQQIDPSENVDMFLKSFEVEYLCKCSLFISDIHMADCLIRSRVSAIRLDVACDDALCSDVEKVIFDPHGSDRDACPDGVDGCPGNDLF